jgi:hypothetical protein
MTIAEQIIMLKNDDALILPNREALDLIRHILERETMNVRAHVNYERGKIKLVRIP